MPTLVIRAFVFTFCLFMMATLEQPEPWRYWGILFLTTITGLGLADSLIKIWRKKR